MGIIGGIGRMIGPLIGSMLQLISLYAVTIHPPISGILLIVAVVVLPKGVIGLSQAVRKTYHSKTAKQLANP